MNINVVTKHTAARSLTRGADDKHERLQRAVSAIARNNPQACRASLIAICLQIRNEILTARKEGHCFPTVTGDWGTGTPALLGPGMWGLFSFGEAWENLTTFLPENVFKQDRGAFKCRSNRKDNSFEGPAIMRDAFESI